jgi:hypothetical protein
MQLYKTCTQAMIESEVMGMWQCNNNNNNNNNKNNNNNDNKSYFLTDLALKRKATTFQEILKKTDNLDVISKGFHLAFKNLQQPDVVWS